MLPSWNVAQQQFTFYATFDSNSECAYIPMGTSVLLPASSYAQDNLRTPRIPAYIKDRSADCGGFIASKVWGEYRYSLQQYVKWLHTWEPLWCAMMDYCCEKELEVITRERQEKTTLNAIEAWSTYKSESFVWVPTIQGYTVQEYQRHAYEMKNLIDDMAKYYADDSYFRVGIGTLCHRNNVTEVQNIVKAVSDILPFVKLHLWGIKLDALRSIDLSNVTSSDSAVWNGFYYTGNDVKEKATSVGLSKRKYSILVNLPAYTERVYLAVEESRRIHEIQNNTMYVEYARKILKQHGWTINIRVRRNRQYVYAARRNGKSVQQISICPVSELPTWLENPVVQRVSQGES